MTGESRAGERRPMPEVTVRDPSRPDRPADVLVAGPEWLPLDPAVKRRRLRVAGAVLLIAALAVGLTELRERRATAAEERRLGRSWSCARSTRAEAGAWTTSISRVS